MDSGDNVWVVALRRHIQHKQEHELISQTTAREKQGLPLAFPEADMSLANITHSEITGLLDTAAHCNKHCLISPYLETSGFR